MKHLMTMTIVVRLIHFSTVQIAFSAHTLLSFSRPQRYFCVIFHQSLWHSVGSITTFDLFLKVSARRFFCLESLHSNDIHIDLIYSIRLLSVVVGCANCLPFLVCSTMRSIINIVPINVIMSYFIVPLHNSSLMPNQQHLRNWSTKTQN